MRLPRIAGGSASTVLFSRCYGARVEGVAPSSPKIEPMEHRDVSG
jgi:hypothetical protein